MTASTYERVQQTVAETLKMRASDIHMNSSADSLDAWDSLAQVNLVMSLEENFDIELDIDEVMELTSVRAIVEHLENNGIRLSPMMGIAHKLSDLALRRLPREQILSLRARYLAARRALGSMERVVFGGFDTGALRQHLEERIGSDFEILMVHSSMNRLTSTYSGNPLELVRMLIDFCGPERTLAMPTFYFGDPDIGNVHETFARNPVCELRRLPSQMGLATELFRRSKGVIRSRHPAYSVAALGPMARELVAGHENARWPAGLGSPFEVMARQNAQVLGIGKSFHVMTQAHHVEALLGDDFPVERNPVDPRGPTVVTVKDRDAQVQVELPRGGDFAWKFRIERLPALVPGDQLQVWRFHNVPMFSARAGDVTRSLLDAARAGRCLYDRP